MHTKELDADDIDVDIEILRAPLQRRGQFVKESSISNFVDTQNLVNPHIGSI